MTPDRLRELLAVLGWSQRGLARLVNRDVSLVRRWCDGERSVPVEVGEWLERMAERIAKMLAADPPPQPTRGPRAAVQVGSDATA